MPVDPYVYPQTRVLLNRLNIRNAAHLRRVEAGITTAALADLGARILPGDYDLPHLQLFHKEIFGDLYPWAGQIRVVRIAKTDLFCLPQFIDANAADLFAALAKERYLRGLPRDRFVDRLTYYFAEVNALHPFREGNGRTQRAFVHQLCREAGWPITWSGLNPDHNDSVSTKSLRGDNDPLRDLLDQLMLRNPKAEM